MPSDFKAKVSSSIHTSQNHKGIHPHGRLNLSVPGDSKSRELYSSSRTPSPSSSHNTGFSPHVEVSGRYGGGGLAGTGSIGASYQGHNHSISTSVSRPFSTFSNKGSNTFTTSIGAKL